MNATIKTYQNEEPVRECPYCPESENKRPGRGLYNHVNLTDEPQGPHGPAGSVPDDFVVKECPIVGYTNVKLNRRADYQQDHNRYVCQYCGTTHKGKSGLGVHLNNHVGDPLHDEPEIHRQVNSGEINYDEHPRFPATKDGRILVPSESYLGEVTLTREEIEDQFIVEVDPDLDPVDTAINIDPKDYTEPTDGDVIDELRGQLHEYVARDEKIDPVQAFQMFKDSIDRRAQV